MWNEKCVFLIKKMQKKPETYIVHHIQPSLFWQNSMEHRGPIRDKVTENFEALVNIIHTSNKVAHGYSEEAAFLYIYLYVCVRVCINK